MNLLRIVLSLFVSSCLAGILSSCSKAPDKTATAVGDQKQQAEIKPGSDSTGKLAAEKSTSQEVVTNPVVSQPSLPETTLIAKDKGMPIAAPAVAPEKVNLEVLPRDTVILTVGATPITVGDYRRMFKLEQLRLQSTATADPAVRQRLLAEAKARHVVLTAQEKEKLLYAASGGKSPQSKEFKQFLSQRSISQQQFNSEVMDVGLALKTINSLLEQSVLNGLVNRELLCEAAQAAGFSSKAMNRYFQIKHSPSYKNLLDTSKLAADELKEELVKDELNELMIGKIQQSTAPSDKEVEAFYKTNRAAFKHKERLRLSQIIIAAPSEDVGPVQSVKTQVLRANPKLSGKELDATVALTIEHQRQKAQEVLNKALAGEDFAGLANLYTEDIPSKVAKNGGDLGFQEKEHLIPKLAEALWSLKSGTVYPGLIQTSLGFHIVKVTAHEPAGTSPLAEVKELLRATVKQQKGSDAVNRWLAKKHSTTKIVLAPRFAKLLLGGQAGVGDTTSRAN